MSKTYAIKLYNVFSDADQTFRYESEEMRDTDFDKMASNLGTDTVFKWSSSCYICLKFFYKIHKEEFEG